MVKMNKTWLLFLFFVAGSIRVFCQPGQDLVYMADKAFDSGDKAKAKSLYLQAAGMNNADAHYNLAYKYILTKKESIFHFSEAAKQGHADALKYLFDDLVFRANSLKEANPELAMEVYQAAKKSNPLLTFYGEKEEVAAIRKSIEAGPFNGDEFTAKYGLVFNDREPGYAIWELAEEASRGGRFGNPDPRLVLQLVSRGGCVPAELEAAVDAAWQNWKSGKVVEFNLCDYVTSGFGQAYCAGREEEKENKINRERIQALTLKLKNGAGELLPDAFKAASRFIEEKAWNEEGHDGTGYVAWARESMMLQKSAWLGLVEKINSGVNPDTVVNRGDPDKALNEVYRMLINQLTKEPISGMNYSVTAAGVRSVQRLWILHRDASASLFNRMAPLVSESAWKDWLTRIRTNELKKIPGLRDQP